MIMYLASAFLLQMGFLGFLRIGYSQKKWMDISVLATSNNSKECIVFHK